MKTVVRARAQVSAKRLTLIAFVVLTACSSVLPPAPEKPLETDAIKDRATAIRMGQDACVAAWALPRARKEPGWYADLHNRVWHVAQRYKACEGFGSDLDAATGKQIGGCSICVA